MNLNKHQLYVLAQNSEH